MSARNKERIPEGPPPITRTPFPASRKVYVPGTLHPDVRVPMREISLNPTRVNGVLEENPSITVYDCSGPYTDPDVDIDVHRGLPPLCGVACRVCCHAHCTPCRRAARASACTRSPALPEQLIHYVMLAQTRILRLVGPH